jgi:hypothetical protein
MLTWSSLIGSSSTNQSRLLYECQITKVSISGSLEICTQSAHVGHLAWAISCLCCRCNSLTDSSHTNWHMSLLRTTYEIRVEDKCNNPCKICIKQDTDE